MKILSLENLFISVVKVVLEVIVKPHHEEDIFVIYTSASASGNNKDILLVVGFNYNLPCLYIYSLVLLKLMMTSRRIKIYPWHVACVSAHVLY